MPINRYVKGILTVIALALVTIACNQVSTPPSTARAQGPFADVVFSGSPSEFLAINTKSGEIWAYTQTIQGTRVEYRGKLVELGKPLSRDH